MTSFPRLSKDQKLAPGIRKEKGERSKTEAAALPCRDEAFLTPLVVSKSQYHRDYQAARVRPMSPPAVDGIVLNVASCEDTSKGNGMDETAIQSDIMHIR